MVRNLLIPYAYCRTHADYHAPDRTADDCIMMSGKHRVHVRPSRLGTLHFYRPGGGGGGGPETAAHIYAKMFIKRSMRLYAVIDGEPTLVRFSRCDIEQRLDERTPDVTGIIEHMWPPRFSAGTRFFVEIHATNEATRDPKRIPALREIGVPCVEISLPERAVAYNFGDGEMKEVRARFEAYMKTVMRMPRHAEWLVPDTVLPWKELPGTIRLLQRSP